MGTGHSVVAVIQARLKSERLPEKVLLPLAEKSIIEHVIERASAIQGVSQVVLATGNCDDNGPLEAIAEKNGIGFFCGSDENVLERFVQAAAPYDPEFIVRITADNPLTDIAYNSLGLQWALENKPDLASVANIPLGTAVEIIRYEALLTALEKSDEPYHFEHVTPYIKENPREFNIERYPVDFYASAHDLRLTVDTPEDYTLMKIIFRHLYDGEPFSILRVMAFLTEQKHLLKINNMVHQRPMTHSAQPYVAC